MVGHDVGTREREPFLGHSGSEYVMIAKHEKYLIGNGKQELFLPQEGDFNLVTGERILNRRERRLREGIFIQTWEVLLPR